MSRGQGHFGKVSLYCYDPTNDGTGEMVAVKAIKAGCGPQLRTCWRREIDILRTLHHKHIVKYKGCCEDQGARSPGPHWNFWLELQAGGHTSMGVPGLPPPSPPAPWPLLGPG